MTPPDVTPDFVAYRKIPRLNRPCIVTEKIDGTNAQIHVLERGEILAASRNRYLTLEADNHGFCAWVKEHEDELRTLGPGRHFGEWWGRGIQRGYGLTDRRFSLFNVAKWGCFLDRPRCCDVVPVLGTVESLASGEIDDMAERSRQYGSVAAPGFMRPEGIVILHTASGWLFKATFDGDAAKGADGAPHLSA